MRGIPLPLAASLLLLLGLLPVARADLDVNTVVGRVTLDGEPAAEGTMVTVHDIATGHRQTTPVDGPMIPFFLKGEGRYDTGDVPAFNTGDEVVVTIGGAQGSSRAYPKAGTTTVNLVAISTSPPRISAIPEQRGLEDVPWTLDLAPYVRDQDTPPARDDVGVDVLGHQGGVHPVPAGGQAGHGQCGRRVAATLGSDVDLRITHANPDVHLREAQRCVAPHVLLGDLAKRQPLGGLGDGGLLQHLQVHTHLVVHHVATVHDDVHATERTGAEPPPE